MIVKKNAYIKNQIRQKDSIHSKSISRSYKRKLTGVLFLLPISVVMVVFFIYPSLLSMYYSFFLWDGIGDNKEFVGLKNFFRLPNAPGIYTSITNTIFLFIGATILINLLALLIALILDKKEKSSINRNFLRVLFFFPAILSGIVVAVLWKIMYTYEGGLINEVLISLGLGSLRADWIGKPFIVMVSMIFAYVWYQLGISIVIYMAGLQSIPTQLYETGKIDGTNRWTEFKYITLKMLAPAITINVIYTSINALKAFDFPFALTAGGPGYYSEVMPIKIYFYAFNTMDYGLGSALSVLMVLFILTISFFQVIVLKKKEDIY